MDRSIKFYGDALDLHEVRRKTTDDFIIVYLSNDSSDFELELTWLKEHPQPYDLGECEFHLAFKADDFDLAHKKHEEMGCICFEILKWVSISSRTRTDIARNFAVTQNKPKKRRRFAFSDAFGML